MTEAFVVLLGLCVGSFLNVCIHRLPLGESIVRPRSHCPHCSSVIPAYDNVPLLSFAVLGGRCRKCNAPISWRYPLVEALTAALLLLVYLRIGLHPEAVAYGAFVAALIVITFIDIDYMIIPDAISLPGIPIGIAVAALGYGPDLRDSLIGAAVGGGLLYAVAATYAFATGRDGLGGGDIKLLGMIGAFVGWRGVLVALLIGSLTGSVFGVGLMLLRGTDSKVPIAFGPFLSAGAVVAVLYGDPLLDWYLSLAER